MSLNFSSVQEQIKVAKGQTLMSPQMVAGRFFIIIHSGKIAVTSSPPGVNNRYFCLNHFSANMFLGTLSFYAEKPYYYSSIAEQDSIISIYPMKDLDAICQTYPRVTAQILRQMNRTIAVYTKNISLLKKVTLLFADLNNKVMLYLDNFFLSGANRNDKMHANRLNDLKQAANRFKINVQKEKIFITPTATLSQSLIKSMPNMAIVSNRTLESSLLQLDSDMLKDLFIKNKQIGHALYHSTAQTLIKVLEANYSLVNTLHQEWQSLGGMSDSTLKMLPAISKTLPKQWPSNVVNALNVTKEAISNVFTENSEQLATLFVESNAADKAATLFTKQLEQLACLYSDGPKEPEIAATSNGAEETPAIVSAASQKLLDTDVYDIISKITNIDKDLVKQTQTALVNTKKIKHLFEANTDEKKLIKQANEAFIKLYTDVFLKTKDTKVKSLEGLNLFLHYGILEPSIIPPNIISVLPPMGSVNTPQPVAKKQLHIIHLYEWLNLIYEEKEFPSNSEFGITYQKYLIDKQKRMSTRVKEAFEGRPVAERKFSLINYEMQNMVSSCMRFVSDTPTKAIHALSNINVPNSIDNFILTKEKIAEGVNEILGIDYQLFNREGLYKLTSTANDIIKVDVLPYFVIVPTIGSKIMFWQEIYGTSKQTRGRFIAPLIYTGNLKDNLLRCLSEFRWELCRSSKGISWMDPIDGGISGAFYDYLVSFKKNSKISVEAKERIKLLITTSRKNTRRAFISVYKLWIEFEARGIMKIDPVARDFFFRHIPFAKSIRNTLVKSPAYEKAINRHNHQAGRMVENLNRKYRHHVDKHGKVISLLQDNVNFYLK